MTHATEPHASDAESMLAGDTATNADSVLDSADSASSDARALAWVNDRGLRPTAKADEVVVAPDLLAAVPWRRTKAGWIPVGVLAALVAAYVGATLAWPLTNVQPTVSSTTVEPATGPTGTLTWPSDGSAALALQDGPSAVSTSVSTPMASITKVVTVMTILQAKPLAVGEQGDAYTFTWEDSQTYWEYLMNDESALDVPVDGQLTEYQLLEGILLGSAGNYTDYLVDQIWESDEAYVAAATDWLASAGITGITVVEPTGIDPDNIATPAALLQLAEVAMQHPVVAEIAAKKSVELPGAGLVENTNKLINDPGVVGLKTGVLEGWNLLSVKNITVGDETVQAYAVVLDQLDEDGRTNTSRDLFTELEAALQPVTVVAKGTKFGTVTTVWGEKTSIVAASDANVSLWRAPSTVSSTLELTGDLSKDADAGTMTATGVLHSVEVPLVLETEVAPPSLLWRLTHPLELFGLR